MFVVMGTYVNDLRNKNTTENATLGALSTFLCSVALIYSFADVSGAHFNPAVTFATMVTGKMGVKKGFAYIGVQMFSSVLATLALMCVFPDVPGDNAAGFKGNVFDIARAVVVQPSANKVNAFFMELILVPYFKYRPLFWCT
jgi:glycerol uptake facilitator-like aquaporin